MGRETNMFNPAGDDTVNHIQRLNRELLALGRRARTLFVETHARMLTRMAASHDQLADESQVEWTSKVLRAQATMMREVADVSSKIARS